MRLTELVQLAISRLGTARIRSALTMLGIIIGVASVVALVAVGQGASSGITNRISSLGTNLLTINAGATFSGGVRQAAGSATTLTLDDATAISQLDGVAAVAPELSSSQTVIAGHENTTTTILGTTQDYPTVRAYDLWQGSFLTDTSVEQSLRVAVLGSTTADDLGLGAKDDRLDDLDRRHPVPAGRHPAGQGRDELHERRRPGPHPGQHAQAVLHRLGVVGRPLDRRERRLGRPDRGGEGGRSRRCSNSGMTSPPARATTSPSPTRPSCSRPRPRSTAS